MKERAFSMRNRTSMRKTCSLWDLIGYSYQKKKKKASPISAAWVRHIGDAYEGGFSLTATKTTNRPPGGNKDHMSWGGFSDLLPCSSSYGFSVTATKTIDRSYRGIEVHWGGFNSPLPLIHLATKWCLYPLSSFLGWEPKTPESNTHGLRLFLKAYFHRLYTVRILPWVLHINLFSRTHSPS